jgi:hypothetical protein
MPGTQLFRRLWSEGRILNTGGGNNTDCELNFLPRMNATRLLEGYRHVLTRIYACDAYYDRVKLFLSRCQPEFRQRWSYGSLRAFFSSMVHQGLLGKSRLSYWKFLLTAATRYRRSFGAAMTLAVMGHITSGWSLTSSPKQTLDRRRGLRKSILASRRPSLSLGQSKAILRNKHSVEMNPPMLPKKPSFRSLAVVRGIIGPDCG